MAIDTKDQHKFTLKPLTFAVRRQVLASTGAMLLVSGVATAPEATGSTQCLLR